jgi:hypothetical protein
MRLTQPGVYFHIRREICATAGRLILYAKNVIKIKMRDYQAVNI